jgi:hypothetical protein
MLAHYTRVCGRDPKRSSRVAKTVDRRLYENYLRKAEEMLDVAKYAGASESNAEVDLMTEKQAADAVRRALRILSKVRQKLQ